MSIETQQDRDRHTLLLSGELDIATAAALEARAQQLCEGPASELVLDLSGLDFIDSAGLNAIVRIRALCQEHMCELCLMPGERPVQRLFEVTRLIDRLPFRKSRHAHHEDAAADAAAPQESSPQPTRADGDAER